MRFVGDGAPWSRHTTELFIEREQVQAAAHGFCRWALIHAADSRLIGFCGFAASDEGPEIGWRLAPAYWGRGLASEAARAALHHGFETLGFSQVIATVQPDNRASIRIVEKLGMLFQQRVQRNGRELAVYSTGQIASR